MGCTSGQTVSPAMIGWSGLIAEEVAATNAALQSADALVKSLDEQISRAEYLRSVYTDDGARIDSHRTADMCCGIHCDDQSQLAPSARHHRRQLEGCSRDVKFLMPICELTVQAPSKAFRGLVRTGPSARGHTATRRAGSAEPNVRSKERSWLWDRLALGACRHPLLPELMHASCQVSFES